jgi:hypothetical protein
MDNQTAGGMVFHRGNHQILDDKSTGGMAFCQEYQLMDIGHGFRPARSKFAKKILQALTILQSVT